MWFYFSFSKSSNVRLEIQEKESITLVVEAVGFPCFVTKVFETRSSFSVCSRIQQLPYFYLK